MNNANLAHFARRLGLGGLAMRGPLAPSGLAWSVDPTEADQLLEPHPQPLNPSLALALALALTLTPNPILSSNPNPSPILAPALILALALAPAPVLPPTRRTSCSPTASRPSSGLYTSTRCARHYIVHYIVRYMVHYNALHGALQCIP